MPILDRIFYQVVDHYRRMLVQVQKIRLSPYENNLKLRSLYRAHDNTILYNNRYHFPLLRRVFLLPNCTDTILFYSTNPKPLQTVLQKLLLLPVLRDTKHIVLSLFPHRLPTGGTYEPQAKLLLRNNVLTDYIK